MLSLDHDFEKRLPLSHRLVKTVGTLREYRGMEAKYRQQTPQVLESLRQAAVIQSVESSNRIEGVIAPLGRIRAIVADNDAPRDRPEAEIAGYRDVLDTIHGSHEGIRLTSGVVQQFHRQLFARTDVRGGGEWKVQPNDIVRIHAGGRQEVRFSPPAPHLVGGLMQSLHDGTNWRHEPLRLQVFVEAPRERIDAVLHQNASIRELVENDWIHLTAIEGNRMFNWRAECRWTLQP